MRAGGGGLWWAVPLLVLLSLYSVRAATCVDATPQTLAAADSFTLASENYTTGGPSPRSERCIWTLPLLSGGAVHAITIDAGLQLQASVDYVKIYDGPTVNAPLLAGLRLVLHANATVYSTSRSITVEYMAGGLMEGPVRGFSLTSRAVVRSASPTVAAQNVTRTSVATLRQAAVARGPYNDSFPLSGVAYPRNITSTFIITSPPGTVVRLALGNVTIADGDSLIVYDNDTRGSVLETLSGRPTWPMLEIFSGTITGSEAASVGGRLLVQFISSPRHKFSVLDRSFMSGFEFDYMAWDPITSTLCGPNVTMVALNASGVLRFPQPFLEPSADPETGPDRSFVAHTLPPAARCRFLLQVPLGYGMRINTVSTGADFRVWIGPDRNAPMVTPIPRAVRPYCAPVDVYGTTFYIQVHTGARDRLEIDYTVDSAPRCEASPPPMFTAPNGTVKFSYAGMFPTRTPNVACMAQIQTGPGTVIRMTNVTLDGSDYLDVYEIGSTGNATFYTRVTPSMLPLSVFHSNGSHIRLVYVAGSGAAHGLSLDYEAIPAPPRTPTYTAVSISSPMIISATAGLDYQMPTAGTYTWNITTAPGDVIWLIAPRVNLRAVDHVWIYDGVDNSAPVIAHYTGKTQVFTDLYSGSSNAFIVLITGACLFDTVPLFEGFSFSLQQATLPCVPDLTFPAVTNIITSGCELLTFPGNLPMGRWFTMNVTLAHDFVGNHPGFCVNWLQAIQSLGDCGQFFEEVTEFYQLDGTALAWRLDEAFVLAPFIQPQFATYGRTIVVSLWTGYSQRYFDRHYYVSARGDVYTDISADINPPVCKGREIISWSQDFDAVTRYISYWPGMHCEWLITANPGYSALITFQAFTGISDILNGIEFLITNVDTNETVRLSDQSSRPCWWCDRFFAGTINSSVLVTFLVPENFTSVLPTRVPRLQLAYSPDFGRSAFCDPLTTIVGRSGDIVSVFQLPTSYVADSESLVLYHTPFECAYHLQGRRDSSWTSVYGDPAIHPGTSSVQDDTDFPRVRVYNGSDASAPLLYDSFTDRLPLDDPLGLRVIPPGLTTGPDAYIRLSVDAPVTVWTPFHGKYFQNTVATQSCVNTDVTEPGAYQFVVGTQNTPGSGCEVTLPPPRGLNEYAMTVVDGGSLQPGEFVSVFVDDVLAAKYGHARDPLTRTEVGARFNTTSFWLPTVTSGLRLVFETAPVDAVGVPAASLLPARIPFQLSFTTSVPSGCYIHSSQAYSVPIDWSLYGPYSDIRMCGDFSQWSMCIMDQSDADRYQECNWVSKISFGAYLSGPTTDFSGNLLLPNLTWAGTVTWRGNGIASFPNLAYIDNCLWLYKSYITADALLGVGTITLINPANITLPSVRRVATLSIPASAISMSLPALEYVGFFTIPTGTALTSLTLGNHTTFGSIHIPAGLSFTMTFPYDLEVETSVDMTGVRVLGNLTLTGSTASVCVTSSQGMPWIKLPNATIAEIAVNGCPNVTTISAPVVTNLVQLQLTNIPVSQVLAPSLTAVAVTNVVLEDLPNLASLPNISAASVNVVSLSVKRTALKKWETLNTQRLDSLIMIDNPEVDSIRVCGTTLQSVNIVNAPQLSCDGVNLTLSGQLVPSYSVTGCGAFASTDQPCILPPPVPQPPATPGCVDPGVPPNGDQYLDSGSFVYDTTVNASVYTTGAQMSFACDYGYRLLGHVVITCRVSGRWSGAAPTCEVDTGALIQPTLGDFTPTLIPLRTVFNLSLVAAQVNLPLRSIDTHDGDVRTGDDQWWIDPNGGSARRRALLASTRQMAFTVAPRVEASYLIVTVEDGYGLQASDDTSVYFTDDCPTPGTFGIGLDCHPCPDGGFCPGGNRVWPLPGYWNEGETSGHVLACPEKTACLGGRYSSCAPGYHGPLCAACDAHFYLRGTECAVCPPKQEETAIYIAAGIFFPLLALAFCTLPDLALDVVIIILKVLQLVRAGSTQGGARLPEGFKQFTFYLSLVTFDFEFIKPTCSFLEDYPYFYTLFWGNGVIAAMLIVPSFLLLSILRLAHKSRREFYVNRTYRAVTIQLSLLYYVIAVRTMQSVTCIRIGDDQRLLADPTIPCADNYTVQIVGGLGLAAFTSGVPIAAAYLVNRLARKGLWRNKRVEARYGFLFSDLNMTSRKHFYVVLPYLQLMCASIAWTVLKVGVAPYILNIVALVILLLTSVIVQPFARGIGNAIAVLSYGLGLAAVVIGLCSLGEDPATLLVGWSLGGIIALFALVMTVLFVFKDIRDSKLRKANIIEPLKDASGIDSLSSAKYLESSMMTTPILESTVTSSMDELTSTKLPVVSPSISLTAAPGGGLERQGTLTHASLILNNGLAGMLRHESTVVSSAASTVGLRNTPVSSEDFDTGHVPGLVNQDPLDFRYFPRESTTSETTPEPVKARPPSP